MVGEKWSNLTGFMDLVNVVDDSLQDKSSVLSLGIGLLIMIFAISLLSTMRMGSDTAFAFASFMGFLTSLFLLFMGFISMGIFVFMSIMLFASSAYLILKKREKRG